MPAPPDGPKFMALFTKPPGDIRLLRQVRPSNHSPSAQPVLATGACSGIALFHEKGLDSLLIGPWLVAGAIEYCCPEFTAGLMLLWLPGFAEALF